VVRADNTYSRVVAGIKTLLPLAALGLLSTLFLISDPVDPTAPVPTAPPNLEERARELGATAPSFAGVTDTGDEIVFRAAKARPFPRQPDRVLADDVTAGIRLSGGAGISIRADTADFDSAGRIAGLRGEVLIATTTGYRIETDRLDTHLDRLLATTPGPVSVASPLGNFTAGRMRLHAPGPGGAAELLFSEGVKLIYRPKMAEVQDK
jgi:lipopolysaccharide export system protein LptC